MNKTIIKLVQAQLNALLGTSLVINGLIDEATHTALLKISVLPTSWSKKQKAVGFVQHIATQNAINAGPIDGKWGPQTDFAYHELVYKLEHGQLPKPWRQDEFTGNPKGRWPLQNEAAMNAFYGPVGTNQGKAHCPYPLKLAWNKRKIVRRFSCHEKIVPSIERVLQKTFDHYGINEIRRLKLDMWGGALNVRKMRGGSKWSTHAWGAAIDWDPQNNALKWDSSKASLANIEYDYWWQCWEDEGAVSLGRAQNRDWMHIQFARLK